MIKNIFKKLKENLKVKCEFCGKSLKRKDAHFEKVKRLEFVYTKNTSFCNKKCCQNYKEYEMSSPKKASLCSMCPVHPETIQQ